MKGYAGRRRRSRTEESQIYRMVSAGKDENRKAAFVRRKGADTWIEECHAVNGQLTCIVSTAQPSGGP